MKLPHYQPLPTITSVGAQNVLNLDEERKQEDEMVLKELKEDDKYSVWSGKFETQDSLTLVKGYFQQWISTPENFRSLIVVSMAAVLLSANRFCFYPYNTQNGQNFTEFWPL